MGGGSEAPLHQLEGLMGSAVSSPSGVPGGTPENLDFGAFWDLRNLLNLRTTSDSGGTCPLLQRRTAPVNDKDISETTTVRFKSVKYESINVKCHCMVDFFLAFVQSLSRSRWSFSG